jgi:hypothetical protein
MLSLLSTEALLSKRMMLVETLQKHQKVTMFVEMLVL